MWVTLTGEKKYRIKALVDTGNTITEETAITEELHKQLGVGFKQKGGDPIGTANKVGPKLKKYGISNPIEMEIPEVGKFQIQPAVVSTLSDRLNIGNGFLINIGQQVPVSLTFHRGNATLQVASRTTELIRQMSNESPVEKIRLGLKEGKGNTVH